MKGHPVAMFASTRALPATLAATERARSAWPLSRAVPVMLTTPPLTVTVRRAPRRAGSDERAETTASSSARSDGSIVATAAELVVSRTVTPGVRTTAPGTTTSARVVVPELRPVVTPGVVVVTVLEPGVVTVLEPGVVVTAVDPVTEPLTEPLVVVLVEGVDDVVAVEGVDEVVVDGDVIVDCEAVVELEGEADWVVPDVLVPAPA